MNVEASHEGWCPSYVKAPFLTADQVTAVHAEIAARGTTPAVRVISPTETVIDRRFRSCENVMFYPGDRAYDLITRGVQRMLPKLRGHYDFDLFSDRPLMMPMVMINCYDSEAEVPGHLSWHDDIGPHPDTRNRKLSISIALNDDYEGGEFEIFNGAYLTPLAEARVGDGVMFSSFTMHRVKPVTKGKRWTAIVWLYGPSFR